MDPLSVSASIFGIITAACKVSSLILDVCHKSLNAPQGLRDLRLEVESMRITLQQLDQFIVRRRTVNSSRAALIVVDQVAIVMMGCVLTFSELEEFVQSLLKDQTRGVGLRLKWVRKASNILDLLTRVRNHKISIMTMLTILEAQSQLEAENAVTELTSMVKQVCKSNRVIEERLCAAGLGMPDSARVSSRRTSSIKAPSKRDTLLPDQPAVRGSTVPTTVSPFGTRLAPRLFNTALENDLISSRVYQRAGKSTTRFSLASNGGHTASWSMLSGVSISEVSDISVLALPIYMDDIVNSNHYDFGQPRNKFGTIVHDASQRHAEKVRRSSSNDIKRSGFSIFTISEPIRRALPEGSTLPLIKSKPEPMAHVDEPKILGVDLEQSVMAAHSDHTLYSMDKREMLKAKIPFLVERCGSFIEQYGLKEPYLFRRPVSEGRLKTLQIELLASITQDSSMDDLGDTHTIHDYAGLLLHYLQEMPAPLVPLAHYHRFIGAYRLSDVPVTRYADIEDMDISLGSTRISALVNCLCALPATNRQTLLFLLLLLRKTTTLAFINEYSEEHILSLFQRYILRGPNDEKDSSPPASLVVCDFMFRFVHELVDRVCQMELHQDF